MEGHFREGEEYWTDGIPELAPGDILTIIVSRDNCFHWLKGPFTEDQLQDALQAWAEQFCEVDDCVDFYYQGEPFGPSITGSFVIKTTAGLN